MVGCSALVETSMKITALRNKQQPTGVIKTSTFFVANTRLDIEEEILKCMVDFKDGNLCSLIQGIREPLIWSPIDKSQLIVILL